LADYRGYERLARFRPVAMPGGTQAIREPWRNLYSHLKDAIGWDGLTTHFPGLDLSAYLQVKPRAMLDAMIATKLNAPAASSCGRLFDAVAAALGVCREQQTYEGEAAIRLEALAESAPSDEVATAYPFAISCLPSGILELDPMPMWNALLCDLARGLPASVMALRFHEGLSDVLVEIARRLGRSDLRTPIFETVALSGGCFQNRILFEGVAARLRQVGFVVLTHTEVPANDGGLSLGQAAIGAARLLES
jgi:hydrogenase maturation protein HypF